MKLQQPLTDRAEPFDEWWQAFDACRERGRPLLVKVREGENTEIATIFPSGHCRTEAEITT